MPESANKPDQRYETRDILGQGGMGVVYRAFDRELKREVALKTIHNALEKGTLELFRKECSVLALLNHPNIVDIYDIGELEDNGQTKPYFVMPLLRGTTLDELIRKPTHNLTLDRVIDIFKQACRGLHAAHERGLVHRDLKPSNIFVLEDDSVKVIDFGVAHMVDTHTSMGIKGTLYYMSPEQLMMRPVSAASDVFSMGVVCYEALAMRRPFDAPSREEIARSILEQNPPPVSEFQPGISRTLSQVVHKAMAKQPLHRFSSVREFATVLEKAYRDEPLEMFDDSKVLPRIERARTALAAGDTEFASEILSELDAGGYFAPEIDPLRKEIDKKHRDAKIRALLTSATKRVEEQEFQLALQKVDDILQLDPEHADALTLRGRIEEKRSTTKVDKWLKLAREHLKNQSYSPAREALQKVFELKPKETRAVRLSAQIDQEEQQFHRLREEKRDLHQAAIDAREHGDISAALSRLEKLVDLDQQVPESSAAEVSAGYQKLYNEVRSEHDEMRGAYDEARGQLEIHGNTEAALEICERWLEKYPNHALFQALQFDIQQRRSQDVSAYIAKIDRDLEAEADLDRCVAILNEALEQYPAEPHFQRTRELTASKRELVQSIVTKARDFEERSQFNEAHGQWEILKTIYSQYPGLQIEIDRLEERREEHSRQEDKARKVEQIDRALELRDFDRAVGMVAAALEEFPDDGELTALEKAAKQGAERGADAGRMLTEGRQLCKEGKTEEGLTRLREAHSLDDRSSEIRISLLENLLSSARHELESSWQAAEPMIQEALEIDPGSALAKSLMTLVKDKRRTELVDKQLAEAREKQLAGDLEGALGEVNKGLADYPEETRLARLQASLEETYAATVAQSQAEQPAPAESGDYHATMTQAVKPEAEASSAPPPPPAAAVPPPPPAAKAPTPPSPPAKPPAAAKAKKPTAKPKKPVAKAAPKKGASKPIPKGAIYAGAGLVVALVMVVALVYLFLGRETVPEAVELALTMNPPGAEILIDGQVARPPYLLEPGTHTIEARLPGYESASESVVVEEGVPPTVNFVLPPLEMSLELVAELDAGTVTVDGEPAGELQEGGFQLTGLSPGEHTLTFSGGRFGEATLVFEVREGAAPRVVEAPATKELHAVVVSSYLGQGHLHSSLGDATVALDEREVGQLTPEGLALAGLSAGAHQLTVGNRPMDVEIGEGPQLFLSLLGDRTVGHMLLVTNQPGAAVYVNDKKYHRTTDKRGRIRLTNLAVKSYSVRVEKEGFTPETSDLEIAKGRTTRWVVDMSLVPPKPGTITIAGGLAGAEVRVDGRSAGQIRANGTLAVPNLQPGSHRIEISKTGYRPKTVDKDLTAGGAITLTAADASLDVATGALAFNVKPAGAALLVETLQAQVKTEKKRHSPAPRRLQLPVGQYSLTFSASGHDTMTVNVELVDSETKEIPVELTRQQRRVELPKKKGGMEGFTAGGWTAQDGWQTRRGGDFVLYERQPSAGAFSFAVRPPAGGLFRKQPPLQWFANYTDQKNYVLFRIDGKNFSRIQVKNGATKELAKKPHGLDSKKDCQIAVKISAGTIVHTVSVDGKQTELDSWNSPGGDLSAGQFGFRVQGNTELRVKNFVYQP